MMKIFRLVHGDKVVEKLTNYVDKNKLKSGVFLALGAFEEAKLMLYELKTKQYFSRKITGPLEVTNFIAVIGKDPAGKAHIHPHVTLANKEFQCFGGHLSEAIVGATLEVCLLESDQEIKRYTDSQIGLNLIK